MSQDSLFGQSVTGVRPLDIPINILSTIMAARSGQLGNVLALRQAVQQRGQEQAVERAKALQLDPVRNDPDTLQALGLRQAQPMRKAAGALTGGTTEQYRREVFPGLPPRIETDDDANILLKTAQASQMRAQAERLQQMNEGGLLGLLRNLNTGGQGGAGAAGDFTVRDMSVDPIGGDMRVNLGPRETLQLPTGAKATTEVVGGKQVIRVPDKGTQGARNQMKQVDAALNLMSRYNQPVRNAQGKEIINPATGKPMLPIEALPTGDSLLENVGLSAADNLPGGRAVLGTVRGTTRRSSSSEYGPALQVLNTIRGGIVSVIKAFGDTANAAVQERIAQLQANLVDDETDTQANAAIKIRETTEALQGLREALAAEGIDPSTVDKAMEDGAANATAPSSTGRTSYDAATRAAIRKELFGE